MKKCLFAIMLLLPSISIFSKQYQSIKKNIFLTTLTQQLAATTAPEETEAIEGIIDQVLSHDFVQSPLCISTSILNHRYTTFEIFVPNSSYSSPLAAPGDADIEDRKTDE